MINAMILFFPSSTSLTVVQYSNIPSSHGYGVYISQLIPYARVCSTYEEFLKRDKLITNKLLIQEYMNEEPRLKSSFRKFGGHYNDLVNRYIVSLRHMLIDVFRTCQTTIYTPDRLRFLPYFVILIYSYEINLLRVNYSMSFSENI